MKQSQYRRILNYVMLTSSEELSEDNKWLFQQGNDPNHTAKATKWWLDDKYAPILEWPAQSPDLNPIKKFWSILDQCSRNRRPQNEQELFEWLRRDWSHITVNVLNRLVESMSKRIHAVIVNNVYATVY